MTARFQVILPGLFDLPLAELTPGLVAEQLPNLNRILRYAITRPNRAYTIDAVLRQALGFNSSAPAGLPLAQAFAQSGVQHPDRLLLGRAVHLQTDLHSAVVVPVPADKSNAQDINNIIKDLNNIFNVDCNIAVDTDGLLQIELKAFAAPSHYPHLLSVLGKPANPYIEQSRQHLPWYRLLNEMQMFMHQHEVNQQRLDRGLLPINSLWVWGGGALSHSVKAELDWFCDDPALNRFAESLALKPRACAELASADPDADKLVIDLRLMEWLKIGLDVDPGDLLIEIDRALLAPLLAEVGRGKAQLSLCASFEFDFETGPVSQYKFWRRPRNLSAWKQRDELS